ncbi:peptidoglycan DD-metalloendopeptidase family protein [Benzoatithermus flavus]|uniref:M23 family metallopeptidase n=1 Tax=Benzoatithermus flavus TaxID=3108223 RepID=A0ABU8XWG4_9PROT
MRNSCAILLLLVIGACTKYQPVAWNGQGSWAQARAEAMVRAAAAEQVAARRAPSAADAPRRFVADASPGSDGGQRYVVASGETLSGIAARYGVPLAVLAKRNGLSPDARVQAGRTLIVPRAAPSMPPDGRVAVAATSSPAPASPRPAAPTVASSGLPPPAGDEKRVAAALRKLAPEAGAITVSALPAAVRPSPRLETAALESPPPMSHEQVEASKRAVRKTPPPLSGDGFLWPVRGEIVNAFGEKPNGARNNGIDIKAPPGTPVLAAENGVVVYAGDEIPGYGNMLLISHAQGFVTAYAHNKELLVRVGDVVTRGERIATVGATGGVAAPQLHFELREGKKPIDPVAHLDSARTRMASSR